MVSFQFHYSNVPAFHASSSHHLQYYMQYHTTCSLALSAVPHAVQYHMQRVTWYHMQHGTVPCTYGVPFLSKLNFRSYLANQWVFREIRSTMLQVVRLSMQSQAAGGTALHAVPCCRWYGSPCSTMLHVVRLSMQYHAACGTALHAVPGCMWYGSPCMQYHAACGTALHAVPGCRWYGSPCCTMLQVVQLHALPCCR